LDLSKKKEEILKAASECFSRYGFEKTTLEDIGKLVGLNKASLYYYYKNKETIFAEVIAIEVQNAIKKIQEDLKDIKGCKNKISVYIKSKINFLKKVMNLHNLSVETMRSIQPIFKNLYNEACDQEVHFISKILKNCIKNNEIINCDTKKVAKTIITITDAIKLKLVQNSESISPTSIDYNKFLEEVLFTISLIIDGLKNK
jgi:AcrR family transcriptional regulator